MTTATAPVINNNDVPLPDATGQQSAFRKWLPLPVMGLAIVIVVLDTTLLNVSLATIVRDLKTDLRSIQWVITAYSLTLAALTITGGRLGDLFGRKRMFVIGAITFAAGSFLASISHSIPTLIWGESIIEGIGAALMLPATVSLLVTHYTGRERAMALGVWGGMAGVGAAIGPVVGGYLATNFSWRWGFRINVLVAAILVLASIAITDKAPRQKSRLDWMGALLSGLGLFFGVFAIIEGSAYGWLTSIKDMVIGGVKLNVAGLSVVPMAAALAIVLLFLFALWERRVARLAKMPLLPPGLFAIEQFRDGVYLTAMMALGQIGLLFSLPIFLQGVLGLDPLHTGYALLPMSVGLLVTAPLGGFMSRKIAPRKLVLLGLMVAGAGLGYLHQILAVDATRTDLIAPLAIYGVGLGLCFSQLANITLSAVSPMLAGAASGVNNTMRQIGASLGVAIIGSIVLVSLTAGLHDGVAASSALTSADKANVDGSIAGQASVVEFGGPIRTAIPLSQAKQLEVRRIAQQSTIDADKNAFLFTIGTMVLAFLLALRLPGGMNMETAGTGSKAAVPEPPPSPPSSNGKAELVDESWPEVLETIESAVPGELERVFAELPYRAGVGEVELTLVDVAKAINSHVQSAGAAGIEPYPLIGYIELEQRFGRIGSSVPSEQAAAMLVGAAVAAGMAGASNGNLESYLAGTVRIMLNGISRGVESPVGY